MLSYQKISRKIRLFNDYNCLANTSINTAREGTEYLKLFIPFFYTDEYTNTQTHTHTRTDLAFNGSALKLNIHVESLISLNSKKRAL